MSTAGNGQKIIINIAGFVLWRVESNSGLGETLDSGR